MGLHPARHVQRVRTDHPDPHQDSLSCACRASDRSASHCGCIMCQSAGWAAMFVANWSASAWVMTPTSPLVQSSGGWIQHRPAPVVLEPAVRRKQGRPGRDRELRRPRRHPGGFAEEVDLDSGAGEVALGHQAHQPAISQPLAEHLEGGSVAAGQRQHLEPEALAVVDESPVQRLGLETLRDGGEGAVCLHQPHPGHIPVAAVRQREHDAAAGGCRRFQIVHPAEHLVELDGPARGGPSSAAGTPRASSGRTTRARRASARPEHRRAAHR